MVGIALYPSNNCSGGWYFMLLVTGYPVHKYTWTIKPASDLVLLKVKEIVQRQNHYLIGKNLKYFDKNLSRRMLDNINNNELDLNINSETENTNNEEDNNEPNDDIQIEGVRFIEDINLPRNIEATTNQQNDTSTNTPYATEYDEEQTLNLSPITEEEPIPRGIEDDKESGEMHINYQNNEYRNRPKKENTA